MAFLRKTFGNNGRPAGRPSRAVSTSATIARWIAIPGAGVALSLWLIAGMAGAYSAGGALSSNSTFMPRIPRDVASGTSPRAEKTDRVVKAAVSEPAGEMRREISVDQRFDTVAARAALSPQNLAAAFGRSGMALSRSYETPPTTLPLKERFAVARAETARHPLPVRFGKRTEVERSSRLALALAGSESVELAYAVASASASNSAFNRLFVSPEGIEEDDGDGEVVLFEDLPDEIPLPTRRPLVDNGPTDKPEKPARRVAKKQDDSSKPGKHRDSSNMLAFAKPDDPREGGGLFSGLFSRSPRPRKGVAIYDISAATVTMPDGTKLEAHSGIGHMADNIKYVDRKMRGPTPPGTYKLTMREALFHGVEAIRLTPVDGKNPYGRNGLLAHTEMLRGRPEQSNGCVAFKDYKRFLAAFKRGKVKHMIVVPGKSRYSLPPTTVADNGRGA